MTATERYKTICDRLQKEYSENYDWSGKSYGDLLEKEGMMLPKIQLNNKINRFNMLLQKQTIPNDMLKKTLMELADYAIMTLVELDNANTENDVVHFKKKEGSARIVSNLVRSSAPSIQQTSSCSICNCYCNDMAFNDYLQKLKECIGVKSPSLEFMKGFDAK